MEIENLKIFCYVVEESSFSGAAKRAFLTQPAVTKKIKLLENHYSMMLFERNHTPPILTPAGERLYHFAKEIINSYEESMDSLQSLKAEASHALKIGSSYTPGEYLLPEIISKFQQIYPSIHIQLSINSTPTILEELEQRKIDLCFIEGDIQHSNLSKKIVTEDEIILVVAPDHPWVKKKNIVSRNLLEERFIRREETSATRKIIENHLAEKIDLAHHPNTLELSTTQAIKSAVQSGLGFGFISRFAVEQELKARLLSQIYVSGISILRPFWIASLPKRFPKESINYFISFSEKFLNSSVNIT
ncbi:LysR family transcriptional regulator [Oceanobacillus salinisoli]|uniref:LysR family transcriptional regulator n=1 Tax=Oceanobacillus salinisoli TaxID=2678611 RepID=UPI0012E1A4D1|nr:LysR family transcriptional regulator [Oceanobacillus salinisoli]